MMYTLTVAHRGYSAVYPENTMLSLEKAVEIGCRAIEFDVGMTRDNVLVLLHDTTVDRTTNGTGNIYNLDWDTVSQLDAGSWKSPEFTGTRIPTFKSVLDKFKGENVFLVIEIKYQSAYGIGIANKIANEILIRRMENQCLVMSFDLQIIDIIKRRFPTLQTGILGSGDTSKAKSLALGGEHSFISWNYSDLNSTIVADWKNAGLGVNAWTINDTAKLQSAYSIGINMLTSNHSDMLVDFANQNSMVQSDVPPVFLKTGNTKVFDGSKWIKGKVKTYDGVTWQNGNVIA